MAARRSLQKKKPVKPCHGLGQYGMLVLSNKDSYKKQIVRVCIEGQSINEPKLKNPAPLLVLGAFCKKQNIFNSQL
jgi:hypothetical protein